MRSKIRRWGNSLALRLPKALAEEIGVADGSVVDIAVENSGLRIEPAAYALQDLLGGITDRNRHGESETGKPVGREIW